MVASLALPRLILRLLALLIPDQVFARSRACVALAGAGSLCTSLPRGSAPLEDPLYVANCLELRLSCRPAAHVRLRRGSPASGRLRNCPEETFS